MSTIIDNNVVSMTFDNSKFEKGVKTTLNTIEKLKSALSFKGFSSGLEEVGQAADYVKVKIGALQTFSITAMQRMSNAAITYGKNLVKSLSVDQISAGWEKYAQKTTGVQTIMSATGESIDTVSESLEKLNWFTDETSYRFTDMITNIGKFTSQGIDLDTAVSAMEGISTWASLSGQGANEASRAMYNLSQAIGVGSVKLMDWKSIENANMATREFKEQAIAAALAAGTLIEKTNEANESVYYAVDKVTGKMTKTAVTVENFSQTLSEGWFTSDVLIDVLNDYGSYADQLYKLQSYVAEGVSKTTSEMIEDVDSITDATTDAEILQMGYTEDAIKLLREMANSESIVAKKSFKAAQEAKTFAEAIDSVREAVASKWMQSFEYVFGNYEEAKRLWTDLANDLYDIFAESGNERNAVLKEWKELVEGGRDDLIDGLKGVFYYLVDVWNMVKEIWHDIFPKQTAEDIAGMVKRFKEFADSLTLDTPIIQAFAYILEDAFSILKHFVSIVKDVYRGFTLASGGVSSFAEKVIDLISRFTYMARQIAAFISNGAVAYRLAYSFGKLFKSITDKLDHLIRRIRFSLQWLGDFEEEGEDLIQTASFLDKVLNALNQTVTKIGEVIDWVCDKIDEIDLSGIEENITNIIFRIKDAASTIKYYGSMIGRVLSGKILVDSGRSEWDDFMESLDDSSGYLESFMKRLVLFSDILYVYMGYMSDAEHKGEFVIDAMKDMFADAVWVVTGAADGIGHSMAYIAESLGGKINTKMYSIFGKYWIWLREYVISPILKVFTSVYRILKAVKDAMSEVFSDKTNRTALTFGGIIQKILGWFAGLADIFYISEERADKLKRAFAGLFSVVKIIANIIGQIFKALPSDISAGKTFVDVILDMAAAVGDWLVNLERALREENAIENFVKSIVNLVSEIARIAKESFGFIKTMFKAFFGVEDTGEKVEDSTKGMAKGVNSLADAIAWLSQQLKKVDIAGNGAVAITIGKKLREVVDSIKLGFMYAVGFIVNLPSVVSTAMTEFQKIIADKTSKAKAKIGELRDKLKEFTDQLTDDVAKRFAEFKDKISPVLEDLKGHFSVFKDELVDLKSKLDLTGLDFKKIFSDIFGAFKSDKGNDKEKISLLDRIKKAIEDLKPKLIDFKDNVLAPAAEKAKTFFGQLKDAFETIFGDVTLGDFIKWLIAGTFVLSIAKLAEAIDGIGESIGKFGTTAMGTFKQFCTGLLELAVGLMLISKIDDQSLAKALTVLEIVALTFVGFMALISRIINGIKDVKFTTILSFKTLFTSFAVALLIVSFSLAKLAKIDDEGLKRALTAALTVFILMAALLKFIQKNFKDSEIEKQVNTFNKLTKMMLTVGLGTALIAFIFSKLDWEDLAKMFVAIGVVYVLTIDLLKYMKKTGIEMNKVSTLKETIQKFVVTLNAFSGAMLKLALMAILFKFVKLIDMVKAFAALAVFIGAMIVTLKLIQKIKVEKATVLNLTNLLDAMSGSLIKIAVMAILFNFVSWPALAKAMLSLVAFIGALWLVIKIMPKGNDLANRIEMLAKIMNKMIGALALIALVAFMFNFISDEALKKAGITLLAFSGFILIFAGLAGIMSTLGINPAYLEDFATAILLITASFTVFAAGIYIMVAAITTLANAIDESPSKIQLAFEFILQMISQTVETIFGVIISLIPRLLESLIEGFVAMLKVIHDWAPIIKVLVCDILEELEVVFETFLANLIEALLGAISSNKENIKQVLIDLIDILTEVIPHLTLRMFEMLTALMNIFRDQIPVLIDAFYRMIIDIVNGICTALKNNAEDFGKMIANALGTLVVVAIKALTGLIKGSQEVGKEIDAALSDLFNAIKTSLFGGITEAIDVVTDTLDKAGDAVEGGLNWLADKAEAGWNWITGKSKKSAKEAGEAGAEVANGYIEGAKGALDEHSPSKETEKIGDFATEGLLIGLTDKIDSVKKAGSDIGKNVLSSFASAFSDSEGVAEDAGSGLGTNFLSGLTDKLGDMSVLEGMGMDFNPTITPTIDLSDFSTGIGDMNSMLDDVDGYSNFNVSNAGGANLSSISSMFADKASSQNGNDLDSIASSGTTINLTQNNYSPESLSRTEIYRQTKNLLSTMQQSWGMT